jgi:hypothetical protein
MSVLARKVFQQTNLPLCIQNVWWVEQRLQKYQINGLVAMINKSKKMELDYIDGYDKHGMYCWAHRGDQISIDKFDWLFQILQGLSCDFSWSAWRDLVIVDPLHMDLFIESVHAARINNTENIQYIMAIYHGMVNRVSVKNKGIEEQRIKIIEEEVKNISPELKNEWERLRDRV